MREIKFRVWDYQLEQPRLSYSDEFNTLKEYASMRGLDDTHQQYTGLKDKNGTEIYEGDICIIQVWCGSIYTNCKLPIVFRDGIFGYELYEGTGTYQIMSLDESEEVVGNIYENPELLK